MREKLFNLHQVTRPHYVEAYTKDIISGHNMYKVINNNGTIYQRAICHLGACELIEREVWII